MRAPSTVRTGQDNLWLRGLLFLMLVLTAALFARSALCNIDAPQVSDLHGFRQAQTALSIVTMRDGGPFLRYETPVVGYPWAIPFEFPSYQAICASLVRWCHTPTLMTARVVSIVAYVGTLSMGAWLLYLLNIRPRAIAVFLSLALASPLYMFFARTVMIETTALFFSVSYVAFVAAWIRQQEAEDAETRPITPAILLALAASAAGSICALTKVTTFPSAGLLAGFLYLGWLLRTWRATRRIPPAAALVGAIILTAPILPTYFWTRFADAVKEENLIGSALTSKALTEWNFGTLEQRLNPRVWWLIGRKSIQETVGSLPMFLSLLPFLFAVPARWRRLSVVSFTAFAVGPLLFVNLYLVHNYYACGTAIFLIAGVACVIAGLIDLHPAGNTAGALLPREWRLFSGITLFALCVFAQYREYGRDFKASHEQRVPYYPELVRAVQAACPENRAIVAFGLQWSSELPLYAERRGLLIPSYGYFDTPGNPIAQQAIRRLQAEGGGIGILVFAFGDQRRVLDGEPAFLGLIDELGFARTPVFQDNSFVAYAAPPKTQSQVAMSR